MGNKVDSNISGLSIAEEATLKTLPVTPKWYGLEPNKYSDFGGDITTTARSPIDPSRQRKKGTVTDLDASGGFEMDITKESILPRMMQGFCFADAREDASTAPINGTAIVITAVVSADIKYSGASGLGIFAASDLLFASGFTVAGNNGLKKVSDANATGVTVWGALTDETPPSAGKLERVGHEFASGDADISFSSGICAVTVSAGSFLGFGLTPGQWVFLGGDETGTAFANNVGYGRIKSISTNGKTVVFDSTTFTPVTEVGTGISLRVFWGTVIKNEKLPSNIKRRSYQLERTLGDDGDGTQSEYLEGAVSNEFTLNIPQADKLTAELTFVACDNVQRTGSVGLKNGTRIASQSLEAYNTTSDVYRLRMCVRSDVDPNPSSLFGYISEGSIEINNNVSPNKAVGVLGAFDTSAGDFEVGGSVTAFFTTIAATQAVRNNADVGIYAIFARENGGFIFDVPLLSLGGGRVSVEKDNPITIPLDTNGAENSFGHTLLTEFFAYLPTLAMPQ